MFSWNLAAFCSFHDFVLQRKFANKHCQSSPAFQEPINSIKDAVRLAKGRTYTHMIGLQRMVS